MSDDEERWLPIPWATDYEVSECARVRTWRDRGNHRERLAEPRLIAVRGRGRHLYAYLPRRSDGKARLLNVVSVMDAVFDANAEGCG